MIFTHPAATPWLGICEGKYYMLVCLFVCLAKYLKQDNSAPLAVKDPFEGRQANQSVAHDVSRPASLAALGAYLSPLSIKKTTPRPTY